MISPLIAATMKTLADLVGAVGPLGPRGGEESIKDDADPVAAIMAEAKRGDISISETDVKRAGEVIDLLHAKQFTAIVQPPDGESGAVTIVTSVIGRRHIACLRIDANGKKREQILSPRELNRELKRGRNLVARHALACQSMHADHDHASPFSRSLSLLAFDIRDIYLVALFALIAGVLSLATPLAVESLVNVVSWGAYLQPLLWLGLILLVSLGLGGVFKLLQTVIVEIIQRRQFVRIVADLSHRYPLANSAALAGQDRAELGNRFFDIMTIQKATNVLLLDGISIALSTATGMVLLAFYHPFLLGFDLVLLIAMVAVTWVLGRGGTRTAIDESIAKYKVAHWLQDVLMNPEVFKIGGGAGLAVDRSNRLTADYLSARESQFRVILRQVTFAIFLQVVASTTLLALGGYLVIAGQLTLGQLVASELVVTVVVGAFSKAGKSIEKYYDLMAGVDKVGHLLDIKTDRPAESIPQRAEFGAAAATWSDLTFETLAGDGSPASFVPAGAVAAAQITAITGDDVDGRTQLVAAMNGLSTTRSGTIRVDDVDAATAAGRWSAYVGRPAIFHGTIADNVHLGRDGIGGVKVRSALRAVGLADAVSALPNGLHHPLQSGGFPLTNRQKKQLMLARGLAVSPRLLIVDGIMDGLSGDDIETWFTLFQSRLADCSVIIHTARQSIADRCDHRFDVRQLSHNRISSAT